MAEFQEMPKGGPDGSESLDNTDPSVRAAILGKGGCVPVTVANDTTRQVEHFDTSMPPEKVVSDNVTLKGAAQ